MDKSWSTLSKRRVLKTTIKDGRVGVRWDVDDWIQYIGDQRDVLEEMHFPGLGCRAGPSVVAAGVRRGDMRWLAVGGTCGQTAAWGDGGWWRAHAGGGVCGACGGRVCRASVVLGGSCVDVVGVPCWYVTG